VPNLQSAIRKTSFCELEVNLTYARTAAYYGQHCGGAIAKAEKLSGSG